MRAECREVDLGPHRADIRTPSGLVVELQHSSIDPADIEAREAFYGDMIWLFDARPFLHNVHFSQISSVKPPDVLFDWRYPRKRMRSVCMPLFWDLGDERILEILEVPKTRPGHPYGIGRPMHQNAFLARFLKDAAIAPPPPAGRLLSATRTTQALRGALALGHAFASEDPAVDHTCVHCHRPLDLWFGEPNPRVAEQQCSPRDTRDDHDVPF